MYRLPKIKDISSTRSYTIRAWEIRNFVVQIRPNEPGRPSANSNIFTIFDRFSEWRDTYSITNMSAETIAKTLYHTLFQVFEIHGPLQRIKARNSNRNCSPNYVKFLDVMVKRLHRQLKASMITSCGKYTPAEQTNVTGTQ